jgi:hypothetical protein
MIEKEETIWTYKGTLAYIGPPMLLTKKIISDLEWPIQMKGTYMRIFDDLGKEVNLLYPGTINKDYVGHEIIVEESAMYVDGLVERTSRIEVDGEQISSASYFTNLD